MSDSIEDLAAPIKDAFYAARDSGRTMHQAADDAAAAVLAAGYVHAERLCALEERAMLLQIDRDAALRRIRELEGDLTEARNGRAVDVKALIDQRDRALAKLGRVRALLEALAPEDARMDAYYYGFERTGIGAVDLILSAVARAGKAFHHTQSWADDEVYGFPSCQVMIQDAADSAARELRAILDGSGDE